MPKYVRYLGVYVPIREMNGCLLFQDQAIHVRRNPNLNPRAELVASTIFPSALSFAGLKLRHFQQYFRSVH